MILVKSMFYTNQLYQILSNINTSHAVGNYYDTNSTKISAHAIIVIIIMSLALVAFPVSWDALIDFHTVKMIPQFAVRTADHASLSIIHFATLTVNFFFMIYFLPLTLLSSFGNAIIILFSKHCFKCVHITDAWQQHTIGSKP